MVKHFTAPCLPADYCLQHLRLLCLWSNRCLIVCLIKIIINIRTQTIFLFFSAKPKIILSLSSSQVADADLLFPPYPAKKCEPVLCAYLHGGSRGKAPHSPHSVLLEDLQRPGAFTESCEHHLRLQGERSDLFAGRPTGQGKLEVKGGGLGKVQNE